jgi:energy-converting hydrogenase Eha subunit F
MKRMLCLFLSLVMVLGMLSGCGSQPEQMTEKKMTQVSMIQPAPDAEIQKAIDLGFVAEPLQYDYDAQINYAELCGVLDGFVAALFPEKLSDWETVSANYRNADIPMSRMEGALVLLYAAECCGVDAVGYEYNIPLEDLEKAIEVIKNACV